MATTSGMASPRAWGQAMTSTVAVLMSASSGWPKAIHTTRVTTPAASAMKNSRAAALSARICARDWEAWASATRRMMPDSAVCSPTAVTLTRRLPPAATVPATTVSPTSFETGRDSPLIIDSSTSAAPSTTVPSAGTRVPGRTSTTSSSARAWSGTVSSDPSGRTRSAASGSSSANALRAPCACMMERISSQCPRLMTVISVASSHHTSTAKAPRVAAQEAMKATTMAREIRVIIPG